MLSDQLFDVGDEAVEQSSDDCYTPAWVFTAMGLHFDLDVAAPPGGPRYVPADRWLTAADDGRTKAWEGLVWCNPPFSGFRPGRTGGRRTTGASFSVRSNPRSGGPRP